MSTENIIESWDKIKNIEYDFLIFILLIIFIFKIKDIVDLFFQISKFKTDKLKSSLELLEVSKESNKNEIEMVKSMMRLHAIRISASLYSNKCVELYCYLFQKVGVTNMQGVNKTIEFITINDNTFIFDDKALKKRRCSAILVTIISIAWFIAMSLFYNGNDGINFSWLFKLLSLIIIAMCIYVFIKVIPNDLEVVKIKGLLLNTNVNEFEEFKKIHH